MDIKAKYDKNKSLFVITALLLSGFLITGTLLLLRHLSHLKKGHMKANGIQQSTIDLLSKEEGRRNDVYLDIAGIPTVGIGHRVLKQDGLTLGQKIDDALVDTYFRNDSAIAANAINKYVKVPLNQFQFDALLSLIYNIGTGAFSKSTLLKYINGKKTKQDITSAWLSWNHAGGKESSALTARRNREVNIFYS